MSVALWDSARQYGEAAIAWMHVHYTVLRGTRGGNGGATLQCDHARPRPPRSGCRTVVSSFSTPFQASIGILVLSAAWRLDRKISDALMPLTGITGCPERPCHDRQAAAWPARPSNVVRNAAKRGWAMKRCSACRWNCQPRKREGQGVRCHVSRRLTASAFEVGKGRQDTDMACGCTASVYKSRLLFAFALHISLLT